MSLRPIYHQEDHRIESHIFLCFLAYCLHTTIKQISRLSAPGLTPRAIIEKFSKIQMIDVHIPIDDNLTLILARYTQPTPELRLLLHKLNLRLPAQPPPKISSPISQM